MIRYTNIESRWAVRMIITMFVVLMLVIFTPLSVTATRTIQIEKEINIEADPRYNWDVRTNYADENATTSWDEWQDFIDLSGAKGSFVGPLVRDNILDLRKEFILDSNISSNWTEFTDDTTNKFDWEVNGSILRGYTGGDTFPASRHSALVPNDFNFTLTKTVSTEIMFNTTAVSHTTAGLYFDLNISDGSGYVLSLIYDNDVPTTLGLFRYSGWETASAILYSGLVSVQAETWYTLRMDFNEDHDFVWVYFNGTLMYCDNITFDPGHVVAVYVETTGAGMLSNGEILFKWFGAYYSPIFVAGVMQFSPNDIMSGGSRWWIRSPIVIEDEYLLNATHLNISMKVYHVQNVRILNFTVDNVTRDIYPRQFSHSTLIVNETYDFMRPNTNTTLTENGHYIVNNRTFMEVKAPIFPLTDEAYAFCFLINGSIPINIAYTEADLGQDDIFLSFIDDGVDQEIDYVVEADMGLSFLFTEGMRDGVTGEDFNFTMDYDKVMGITNGYYPNFQYDEQHTNNVSDTHLTIIDRKIWEDTSVRTARTDPVIYNGLAYYTELSGTTGRIVSYNITTGVRVDQVTIDTGMGSTIIPAVVDYTNEYIIVPFKNKVRGYDLDCVPQWTYTSPGAEWWDAGGVYTYYSGEDYFVIGQDDSAVCVDTANGNQRWVKVLTTVGALFVEANWETPSVPAISRDGEYAYVVHNTWDAASTNFRAIIDKINLVTSVISNTRKETLFAGEHSTPVVDMDGYVFMTFVAKTMGSVVSNDTLSNYTDTLTVGYNATGYYGPIASYVSSLYISNVVDPGTVENNGTIDPLLGSIRYPGHGLVRVNASDGEIIWSHYISDEMTSPLVVGGKVYVGSYDGFIYIFDVFGKNLTRPTLDSDGDGMQDWWELKCDMDPFVSNWTDDTDGDGILDYYEYLHGYSPTSGSNIADVNMLFNLQPHLIKKILIEYGGVTMENPAVTVDALVNATTRFPDNSIRRMFVATKFGIEIWMDDFYDYNWTNFTIQFVSNIKIDLNDNEHNYLTFMLPFLPRANNTGVTPLARVNVTCIDPGITWQFEWIREIDEYILAYIPIPDTAFGSGTFMVNVTVGFGISDYEIDDELYFNFSSFIQGRVPVYGNVFNNDWFKIINGTNERTVWFNYYHSLQGTFGAWELMMPTVYAIYRTNLPADMVSQVHLAGVPIHIISVDSYTDAQGRTFRTADANEIYMIDDYDLFPLDVENDLHKITLRDTFNFIANKVLDALRWAFGPLWDKIVSFAVGVGSFLLKIIEWIVEAIQFMANLILQILVSTISVLLFIAVVWIIWRFFKLMRHIGKTLDVNEASRWVEEQSAFNTRLITYMSMGILIMFSVLGWIIGLIR